MQRGLIERDGLWYCTNAMCVRSYEPFGSAASAKSHPWAAHKIRSQFAGSSKRRDRRYRSAPVASTATRQRVDEFLGEFDIDDIKRRKLRLSILEAIGIPSDAPPPPAIGIPSIAERAAAVKFKKDPLWPGEIETLRRMVLFAVHDFAIRTQREPRFVVDALAQICDRRFYRQGIGLVDSGTKSEGNAFKLDRLAELFSPGGRI